MKAVNRHDPDSRLSCRPYSESIVRWFDDVWQWIQLYVSSNRVGIFNGLLSLVDVA
jgi:hypothetical protein